MTTLQLLDLVDLLCAQDTRPGRAKVLKEAIDVWGVNAFVAACVESLDAELMPGVEVELTAGQAV